MEAEARFAPLVPRRSTLEVESLEEGTGDNSYPPLDHSASYSSSLISHPVAPEATSNRPLLLVKLTGYRLLTTAIFVTFGTVKAKAALDGAAVTATALDWVLGVILGTMLYWIGLYEGVQPRVAVWFFHDDYTLDILYFPLGVILFSSILGALLLSALISAKLFTLAWGKIPLPEGLKSALGIVVLGLLFYPLMALVMGAMFFLVAIPLVFIAALVQHLGGHRFGAGVLNGYGSQFMASPLAYTQLTVIVSVLIFTQTEFMTSLENLLGLPNRSLGGGVNF